MEHDAIVTNPWSTLRRFTPAHIGLGRAGVSLPTQTMLGIPTRAREGARRGA